MRRRVTLGRVERRVKYRIEARKVTHCTLEGCNEHRRVVLKQCYINK